MAERRRFPWLMALPPVIFAALAGLFLSGMFRDNPDELPSTRIGQMPPPVSQQRLADYPALPDADLASGKVQVVNFWASWCPPCRAEHPVLLQMQARGIALGGVNIKDDAGDATAYLAREGNPFAGISYDPKGRTAIDWGVTAPPETFIIGKDGRIVFRFTGPLVGTDYEKRFVPALEQALAQ